MEKSEIGIDLGGTKVLLVAGAIQSKHPTGKSFTPDMLKSLLEAFILKHQLEPVLIGIAVPGLIHGNRVADCDVLPEFKGWDPENEWKAITCPIALCNDVKAALCGEFPAISPDFSGGIIMVGTAIGASFISNGSEIKGKDGWAGEFGYFPIHTKDGIKRLDELSGGQYLADSLGISSSEMAEKAIAGDVKVLRHIETGGYFLGVAIAGIINFLNPDVIAIGGGTVKLPGYWEAVLKAVKEHVIPIFWEEGMIRKAGSGDQVVALGALNRAKSLS